MRTIAEGCARIPWRCRKDYILGVNKEPNIRFLLPNVAIAILLALDTFETNLDGVLEPSLELSTHS